MTSGAGDDDDDGVGVVSISSITTVTSTGSHMLKINGYSAGKRAMKHGTYATSCEFEAAGHTWCINYYPSGYDPGNGRGKEAADHISLNLRLARNVDDVVVNARFRFSLVPHHRSNNAAAGGGKTKPKPPQVVPYHRQSLAAEFKRTFSYGFPCFVRREVLEKSEYLVDDSFAVRCDIEVVETSAVSDLTVEAHDLFRLSLLPPPCTLKD